MFPRKYRIHAFLALLALVIIFYPSYSKKPDQQRLDASSLAAVHFLELVDAGQYEQSWQGAAGYLQQEIPLEEWTSRLSEVRSAAGKLLERKQKDYIYTKDAKQGIPEGEYMVFIFNSTFATKQNIHETVTLILEQDKIWRVAGYFIE